MPQTLPHDWNDEQVVQAFSVFATSPDLLARLTTWFEDNGSVRFKGQDVPSCANEVGCHKGEIAPAGAHVDDRHSRARPGTTGTVRNFKIPS